MHILCLQLTTFYRAIKGSGSGRGQGISRVISHCKALKLSTHLSTGCPHTPFICRGLYPGASAPLFNPCPPLIHNPTTAKRSPLLLSLAAEDSYPAIHRCSLVSFPSNLPRDFRPRGKEQLLDQGTGPVPVPARSFSAPVPFLDSPDPTIPARRWSCDHGHSEALFILMNPGRRKKPAYWLTAVVWRTDLPG